jgi:hypothetical protein
MLYGRILFAYLLVTTVQSENARKQPPAVVIPLKEIWAYDMPGTRKVGDLDATKDRSGVTIHPIVKQIVHSLAARRPKEGEPVGPAFIVSGTGKDALENARDAVSNSATSSKVFPPETELTLVFYTVLGAPPTHIQSVKRAGSLITVKYQFQSHNTRDDTLHFALIPLGHLAEDKYEIKIQRVGPVDTNAGKLGMITRMERVVCHGTSLTVRKEKL